MSDTELQKELAWLVDNSEGVVGLRVDGGVMPWPDVLNKYVRHWRDTGDGN